MRSYYSNNLSCLATNRYLALKVLNLKNLNSQHKLLLADKFRGVNFYTDEALQIYLGINLVRP